MVIVQHHHIVVHRSMNRQVPQCSPHCYCCGGGVGEGKRGGWSWLISFGSVSFYGPVRIRGLGLYGRQSNKVKVISQNRRTLNLARIPQSVRWIDHRLTSASTNYPTIRNKLGFAPEERAFFTQSTRLNSFPSPRHSSTGAVCLSEYELFGNRNCISIQSLCICHGVYFGLRGTSNLESCIPKEGTEDIFNYLNY